MGTMVGDDGDPGANQIGVAPHARWIAASGIFPAFANGNSGPSCSTSGSPGDYVASYRAGAFDPLRGGGK